MTSVISCCKCYDPPCYCSYHCAIEDGNEVVLTGGLDNHEGHSIRIGDMVDWVTRYNMQGQATSLPALNTARNHHACGTIKKSDGATVRSQRSGGSWRVFFNEFPVLYRVRWGRLGLLRDLHGDSGEGGRILLADGSKLTICQRCFQRSVSS